MEAGASDYYYVHNALYIRSYIHNDFFLLNLKAKVNFEK